MKICGVKSPYNEKPSSILSKSTEEVKYVYLLSVSSSHCMIYVGDVEIPITWTNMRLLTRTRHEEEEELGFNNQGITQPLEVVQRPQFAGLRYTEGESDSSETLSKSKRKENDENTSPSSHGKERVEARSHCHTYTRDIKERYNHSRHSNFHVD